MGNLASYSRPPGTVCATSEWVTFFCNLPAIEGVDKTALVEGIIRDLTDPNVDLSHLAISYVKWSKQLPQFSIFYSKPTFESTVTSQLQAFLTPAFHAMAKEREVEKERAKKKPMRRSPAQPLDTPDNKLK